MERELMERDIINEIQNRNFGELDAMEKAYKDEISDIKNRIKENNDTTHNLLEEEKSLKKQNGLHDDIESIIDKHNLSRKEYGLEDEHPTMPTCHIYISMTELQFKGRKISTTQNEYGFDRKSLIDDVKKTIEVYKWDRKEYDQYMQDPEIAEFHNLGQQISELDKQIKNLAAISIFKKSKLNKEKSKLENKRNKLLDISKKYEQFQKIEKKCSQDNENDLKNLNELVYDLEQLESKEKNNIKRKEELDKQLRSLWNEGRRMEKEYDSLELKVAKHKRCSKEFKLIQIYVENVSEYKDPRKDFKEIFTEKVGSKFTKILDDRLKVYNEAFEAAKKDNKDFNKLSDKEKFDYYMAERDNVVKDEKYDRKWVNGWRTPEYEWDF